MIDEKKLIEELKQSGMIADNDYGNAMVDMINAQPKIGNLDNIKMSDLICKSALLKKMIDDRVFKSPLHEFQHYHNIVKDMPTIEIVKSETSSIVNDAWKEIKIIVNAEINELCNQYIFEDAKEFENSRDVIKTALQQAGYNLE